MNQKSDIIHNLTIRLPESFPAFFKEERKLYENRNGDLTLYGVFLTLASYIHKHYLELSDAQNADFWEWIEWQTQSEDTELTNAVATCFLESLADTDAERHGLPFMSASLVSWFEGYTYRGKRKKRWFEE